MTLSKNVIVVKYDDLNRFSLAYILPIIDQYCLSKNDTELIVTKDVIDTIKKCENCKKIIVLYSLMTPQIFNLIDELKQLQEIKKEFMSKGIEVYLIAGGSHAAGDPIGTIKRLKFDIAFITECENILPKLLDCLIENRDYSNLPNIAYRKDNNVVINRKEFSNNLDQYPPCFEKLNLYAPIEIMRGCKFTCKYCQTPRIYNFTIRFRSIDYIVRWCKYYAHRGIKHLRFIAPNGFAYGSKDGKIPNPEKLEKLLQSIKHEIPDAKIYLGTFPSEVRPDFVTKEVLNVVSKYVSNERIAIGVQTGSNKLLYYIARGHTIEQVYEAVDLVIEYGYKPYLDYIFGLPGETEEDIDESIRSIKYFTSKGCIIRGHTFIPLPGTPFEKEPPGKVHPKYKELIKELSKSRKIEGYWAEQEKIAKLVHEYLTSENELI